MITTANGLTYGHLAQVLRREGFIETVDARGRTFEHPSGARLPLPMLGDKEPLRTYHLVAARGILNDYGILSVDAFDLITVRLSQSDTASIAPPSL